jgi:hypothetical protein
MLASSNYVTNPLLSVNFYFYLANAALALVLTHDNPVTNATPSDASMVFYGLANARERLTPPYSERDGYPGYCVAVTPIVLPLSKLSGAKDDRERLVVGAELLKHEYAAQKAYPSALAIGAQEAELMITSAKSGAAYVKSSHRY